MWIQVMWLGIPCIRHKMRRTCNLTKMHDWDVIVVASVERIVIMVFWTSRRTIIESLILLVLVVHNQVSTNVWRSNSGLKTQTMSQKVDMVRWMK